MPFYKVVSEVRDLFSLFNGKALNGFDGVLDDGLFVHSDRPLNKFNDFC
jgi:hypothetical protein